MNDRYSYSEPLFPGGETRFSGLSLREECNHSLKIFRLLSGTCSIIDAFTGKTVRLKSNYISLPYARKPRAAKATLVECFDDVDLETLAAYFKRLNSNDEFYKLIEFELINCLLARDAGRNLEAFLFLYRLIEGISYSIPLMYVAKSRNFNKTFKSLQGFMPKKDSEGELRFFKGFMKTHWNRESFYQTSFDIDIRSIDVEEMRPIYYRLYLDKVKNTDEVVDKTEDEEIRLSFIGFFDFIVELRNRYFHFLQGSWQDNIKTSQLVYPDLFFKPVTELAINWVAVVLFEVLKFDIDHNYVGHR